MMSRGKPADDRADIRVMQTPSIKEAAYVDIEANDLQVWAIMSNKAKHKRFHTDDVRHL